MATKQVAISIELDLEDGTFTGRMTAAGGAVDTFKKKLDTAAASVHEAESAFGSFAERMKDLATAAIGLQLAFEGLHFLEELPGKVIEANSALQTMQTRLKGLSQAATDQGQNADSQQMLGWILDFSEKAPFSVEAITNSFVKLKSVGIDPTAGSMQALSDAVSKFGGSSEQLDHASLAIMEMAGRGTVSLEQLRRQLGKAVPDAMKDMALGMGVSYGEMIAMVTKGTLASKSAVNDMLIIMEALDSGQSLAHMQNWVGQVGVMQTEWIKLSKVIGDAGFFTAVQEQLQGVIDLMKAGSFNQFAASVGSAMGEFVNFVAQAISVAINFEGEIVRLGEAILIAFAAAKISSLLSAFLGMFTNAFTVMKTAVADISLSYYTGAVASATFWESNTAAAYRASQAIGVARAAFSLLRITFTTIIPVIGPLIAIVIELADAFDLLGNKASDAAKQVEDGIVTAANVATVQKRVNELKGSIAQLTKARDDILASPSSSDSEYLLAASFDKQITQMQEELKRFSADATKGADELSARAAATAGTAALKEINAQMDGVQSVFQQKLADIYEQLNKGPHDKSSQATAQAQENTLLQTLYADKIEIVKQNLEQQKTILDTGDKNQIDSAKGTIKTLLDLQVQYEKALTNLLVAPEKIQKPETKLSPIEQEILHLNEVAAQATAKMTDYGTNLAKVTTELAGGKFKDVTDQQATALKNAASAADDAVQKSKAYLANQQIIKTSTDELNKKLAESKDVAAQAWAQFAAGSHALDPAELRAYTAGLDALIAKLQAAGIDVTAFKAAAADSENDKRFATELANLTKLRDETVKINGEVADDTRQKAEATYNEEVARQYELLNRTKMNAEQRGQAEKTLQDYIAALRKKTNIEEENAVDKQFRDWTNGWKLVGDTAASTINTMNDNLAKMMTGTKVSWSDMITSMIQDLAKLILKEQEAALWKALGGTSGIMGMLGLGGTTASTFSEPVAFPEGPVSVAHTGGIIGADRLASRLVNHSVFAGAQRFHSGGFPGLKQGEVPTILKQGEGVFTQEQMAALGMGSSSNSPPSLEINLINQSGTQMTAQSGGSRFDGNKWVQDIVLKGVSQPGAFRDGMKQAMS